MTEIIITEKLLYEYSEYLTAGERASATVERYLRAVRQFAAHLSGAAANRESAAAWRDRLLETGCAPSGVNVSVAAVNAFFAMLGAQERIKPLRIQRRLFRPAKRELTRGEYERLVDAARLRGRERLALLLETMCATGIRVSEVRYITAKAVAAGRAEISLKGKIRTILIPGRLRRKLLKWARAQKIASGELFVTRTGRSLSRAQIWAEMKNLCSHAGVDPDKVFPHNLRHLFARAFYRVSRDVSRLADVLGHSSIETTRIYLLTTSAEHERTLEKLGLVL